MDVDTLIIGGGQAGIPLAQALVKQGEKVALAEKADLGGSCVNFGCTPSKAVFASAKLVHKAKRAADYGLEIPEVKIDFNAVLNRAKSLVQESRGSLEKIFENGNPKLLRGHARFVNNLADTFELEVAEHRVNAKKVVINTGSRSTLPDISGLNKQKFIHARNWLDHSSLPKQLLILGGGYIGLEMSQFYRRMGADVTVIEASKQIASQEDQEVAQAVQSFLEDEGIVFELNARVNKVSSNNKGISVRFERNTKETTLNATDLFVALGRTPNTDDLGLDKVGVELDEAGYIKVNTYLETTCKRIWAAGDVRGGAMFTHTSYDDFLVLKSQLLGEGTRSKKRLTSYAMFTDPQLARVGLTENEAKNKYKNVSIACYDMASNGKAREEDPVGKV